MAYLVLVKTILTVVHFPDEMFASPSQKESFGWVFLGVLAAVGLFGVWLAQRTGFPEMWDARVSNRQRFVLPALLGMAFGALEIAVDYQTGMTQIVVDASKELRMFHIAFPASALVYPGGAVIVDTLFRLLPLPLFLGGVYLVRWAVTRQWPTADAAGGRGGSRDWGFWAVALVLSWIEPVTQSGVLGPLLGRGFQFKGHEGLVAYWLIEGYAFNLLQAYLFRKYGFLACLTMRVSMYFVWHVVWGLVTQTNV
jgi:hypothetical protein